MDVRTGETQMTWNRGKGKGIAFLRSLIGHQGQDCITWPWTRNGCGYGHVGFNGRIHIASRLMCELARGPAPGLGYEAAHSCGNGHGGCVNPNHLCWKTSQENSIDMIAHGTARPKGRPRRLLSIEQVRELRSLAKSGTPYNVLAGQFGVRPRYVSHVVLGRERPDRPLRHRSTPFPEPQRTEMIQVAKRMRAEGATFVTIANAIGCSRQTAKTFAQ